MKRQDFLAAGAGGAFCASVLAGDAPARRADARASFPRAGGGRVFLNAAGGTPLGDFAEAGLQRYIDLLRLGPGDGREDYARRVQAEIRGLFASMIGARETEIALVHCTKAGEQIVLDGLDPLRTGGNVVTNDLHFSGSLHNLVGLRRAGLDVRIVRARDWAVPLQDMTAAIDDATALVCVTLVSNVNGHVEPLRELAAVAHAHGALVCADVIQAAGIQPIDVRDLDVDFAACSGYKWLYGVHGAGFLFVREPLMGTTLPDRLFPGRARHNYAPWVSRPDPSGDDFVYAPPADASRYEPGHVGYIAYCALYEGLRFLAGVGVETALHHAIRLNKRLVGALDPTRYACISPHADRSPIVSFALEDPDETRRRLEAAGATVALSGDRMRVSPGLYNDETDIDRLAEILNARG